jgi:hypothetical protein
LNTNAQQHKKLQALHTYISSNRYKGLIVGFDSGIKTTYEKAEAIAIKTDDAAQEHPKTFCATIIGFHPSIAPF